MSLTDVCERHEMIGCRTCNPRPEDTRPGPDDSHPFLAKYDGTCWECDLPVVAGEQRIVMRTLSWGTVPVHVRCA